jgi:hypothetical protein
MAEEHLRLSRVANLLTTLSWLPAAWALLQNHHYRFAVSTLSAVRDWRRKVTVTEDKSF